MIAANLSDVQTAMETGSLDIPPGTVPRLLHADDGWLSRSREEGLQCPGPRQCFYNRVWRPMPDIAPAFAKPVALQGSQNCALERWADERMTCGLLDVNGDRLLDRVVDSEAYLGTGEAFTVPLALPGFAVEINNDRQLCDAVGADESTTYLVSLSAGLLDLTGDGIPDYASLRGDWRVSIGTARAPPELRVDGAFGLSATEEFCDEGSSVSKTRSGLFDVNGDGRPDFLTDTGDADRGETDGFTVHQLVSGDGRIGAHEAGRITRIGNGYGARTLLEYELAKTDNRTSHQVPFPEIVVALGANLGREGTWRLARAVSLRVRRRTFALRSGVGYLAGFPVIAARLRCAVCRRRRGTH